MKKLTQLNRLSKFKTLLLTMLVTGCAVSFAQTWPPANSPSRFDSTDLTGAPQPVATKTVNMDMFNLFNLVPSPNGNPADKIMAIAFDEYGSDDNVHLWAYDRFNNQFDHASIHHASRPDVCILNDHVNLYDDYIAALVYESAGMFFRPRRVF